MAFPFICVILAILLPLESVYTESLDNILAPVLSPIMDHVCKDIECGKGTCKPSSSSTFLFECQCDSGWKQTTENSTDHFKFLPCVIPDLLGLGVLGRAVCPVVFRSLRSLALSLGPCSTRPKSYGPPQMMTSPTPTTPLPSPTVAQKSRILAILPKSDRQAQVFNCKPSPPS